ncbi:MAG: hypothetical protein JWQ30_985 [Sediminibacterium sp.]|nr:hypothetical protein [Sediminibacterium sp.]
MSVQIYKRTIIQNLENLKILNTGLVLQINQINTQPELQKFYGQIKRNRANLLHHYQLGKKRGFSFNKSIDELWENYDHSIIKNTIKEIKALKEKQDLQQQAIKRKATYYKMKATCLSKLKKNKDRVGERIIDGIRNASCKEEIDKILDGLPIILLLDLRLRKSKYGDQHLTRNSIYRAISVPKTN